MSTHAAVAARRPRGRLAAVLLVLLTLLPAVTSTAPVPAAAAPGGSGGSGRAVAPLAPLADTFALSSRPGAAVTIYLDFLGGTVTDTVWNVRHGASIDVAPFSTDGAVSTSFSAAELAQVQHVWAVVSEDYAPFDVDVTTRWPGQDALTRTGADDTRFGVRVRVTGGGPVGDGCDCSGAAFVGQIDSTTRQAYFQDVFVFTSAVGGVAKSIGESASHEVGHTFGLTHDGTSGTGGTGGVEYHPGTSPWAPIMGAGFGQPVTQWSRGEYAGATNAEDDVAVIAAVASVVADDHGDTAAVATPLVARRPATGLISTRTDRDAFAFTGDGPVTVTVGVGAHADLDAQLTIRDERGSVVATVDPTAVRVDASTATGLGATWTGTPRPGATWTATVDGVGRAPAYSDYGSLGRYSITVAPPAPTTQTRSPLAFGTRSGLPTARVGQRYLATIRTTGGFGPVELTRVAGALPPGLRLTIIGPGRAKIAGTPVRAGRRAVTLRAADAAGSVRRSFVVRVGQVS